MQPIAFKVYIGNSNHPATPTNLEIGSIKALLIIWLSVFFWFLSILFDAKQKQLNPKKRCAIRCALTHQNYPLNEYIAN